jgi:lysophospholipase L1-like esterase
MKTILCYGDSNTWGYAPATETRYPYAERWTTRLATELGHEYVVIAEGLNGRTTLWPDPVEGEYKSGKTYLPPCLESHQPLDLVVLMLGTNDLKHRFGQSAWDIARSIETLIQLIVYTVNWPEAPTPKILLVAPPPTCVAGTHFAEMFAGADEKSLHLGKYYGEVAEVYGCAFLNAGDVIVSSPVDGIHFDADELPRLAHAVAGRVREVLG